ncbi:ComEA family DNA-binding protein [Paenibacillus sp. FJAT-26967]|uniref:ComEA family DNA-binding protein n=1 Tax=Paenibacillus sp. FJAT-26967 TaxID=1729690 RepID=UPI0008385FDC|nr:helix-hairpin-helix domain-containing protein [Paenibacillus sp. FJAT-26967]
MNWNFKMKIGPLSALAAVVLGLAIWVSAGRGEKIPAGFTSLHGQMEEAMLQAAGASSTTKPGIIGGSGSPDVPGQAAVKGGAESGAAKEAASSGNESGRSDIRAESAMTPSPLPAGGNPRNAPVGGNPENAVPGSVETSPIVSSTAAPAEGTESGESGKISGQGKADGDQPKVDINHGGLEELMKLPGVGPSKAKAIITYREQHGKFKRIDQLLQVKGIGDKMLAKMKPYIMLGAP